MILSRGLAPLVAPLCQSVVRPGMDTPRFLSGQLLLAMPGMGDPRFEHAVIAICVHDEDGAVGIGIGHQRAGLGLRSLMKQLGLDPLWAPPVAFNVSASSAISCWVRVSVLLAASSLLR